MPGDLFATFLDPPRDFTPVPMWFWNDDLDPDEIRRQVRAFHDREVYGFVLHPRMGLPKSIPYLSGRFLDFVGAALEEAERLDMQVFLYDEAMYPSGSAHGEVVRSDPAFAAQSLVRRILAPGLEPAGRLVSLQEITVDPASGIGLEVRLLSPADLADPAALRTGPDRVVAAFVQEPSGGRIRGIHPGEDSRDPDAPMAADLLNPAAVDRFIALTHERYYARFRRHFGRTVRALFTDEPSMMGRGDMTGRIPWTTGFLEEVLEAGLRETDLWNLFDGSPATAGLRRRFDRACRKRLERTYFQKAGDWCVRHGIALAGHPADCDATGPLRHFGIPGQDLVLRRVAPETDTSLAGPESTLAKGVADAARCLGRRRCAVECFGCCIRNGPGTGWDLPMEDLKWYADWLAVRGVNLFIPHAFYYSIRGDRARERPPDVGPHSLWWDRYAGFSRFLRRLSWLVADAVLQAPVALLCTDDRLSWQGARSLYERQVGFCYLPESCLLDGSGRMEGGRLVVGRQSFAVLLVEDREELLPGTLERLENLALSGFPVVFLEDHGPSRPDIVDALARVEGFRADPPSPDLRILDLSREGWRFLLCVNEGPGLVDTFLAGPAPGTPEIWDPWEGRRYRPISVEPGPDPDRLSVRLRLGYRECRVLAFPPGTRMPDREMAGSTDPGVGESRSLLPPDPAWAEAGEGPVPARTLPLTGPWQLRFDDGPTWIDLDGPADWTDLHPDGFYSGWATCRMSFEGPGADSAASLAADSAASLAADSAAEPVPGRWRLDLGRVEEIAEVRLNGRPVGARSWKPYRFDVSGLVRPGSNDLEIRVANSISCRMDRVRKPSGLLGPVRLLQDP